MKNTLLASCLIIPLVTSCSFDKEMKKIEHKAALINRYENVALKLARENRELRAEIKRLEFELQKSKQENAFKLAKRSPETAPSETQSASRGIASFSPVLTKVKKDLVEFKTYKWSADDMIKIADKEFKSKEFEKAAQFYSSVLHYYPKDQRIDDEFYFKAGISAYESGDHHDWTINHFQALMEKYPTSQYYRSAKLWVALTHMKMGERKKFFATVEEFRKKYRNTNEWKILSSYYEKIEEKTHE